MADARDGAVVVVDVMLKPEILDPAGQAVLGALPQLGPAGEGVVGVRIGKRIELTLAGAADDRALDRVRALAEALLANPVIEDFAVRIEPTGP